MYSLISAPVLAFDLARLPGGAATAGLLEDLLAVRSSSWSSLVVPPPSPMLTAARAAAGRATRPSIRDLRPDDPMGTVGLLRSTPIGTLPGLLHCVRTDVVAPAPAPVADLAADAVTAAYLRDLLDDADRRALAAQWLTARRHLPAAPVDLGPQTASIERLLAAVRALRPAGIEALSTADRPGTGEWAAAMHSLTWAVHLSGRVRAAAVVQLRLVQAVELAGVPLADRAEGGWNLLSGAAQALVVRDLADAASTAALLTPAIPALGVGWLLDN